MEKTTAKALASLGVCAIPVTALIVRPDVLDAPVALSIFVMFALFAIWGD